VPVDLTTARKGDTVKFRCGGEAVIRAASLVTYDTINLDFAGNCSEDCAWFHDGKLGFSGEHPLDIIGIVPKAFDWSEVKPGFAFTDSRGEVWLFTAFELWGDPVTISDKVLSCQRKRCLVDKRSFVVHDLTRCPQHDIEVPR
jgi:hypothetical protein